MVPIGEADIFQIVMLAAGAHAFLRRGRAVVITLFQPKKNVLELVHPRIGKEQRGIVVRNKRRGVNLAMALFDEKVQEHPPDLRACQHGIVGINVR